MVGSGCGRGIRRLSRWGGSVICRGRRGGGMRFGWRGEGRRGGVGGLGG